MVYEMYINGTTVLLKAHRIHCHSVLQHCQFLGIQIPRFCYHDQLSLVGNCRLCLVESGSSPKPVLACATEITANLEIYTTGLLIKKVREQMLEFLLGNHPLDCPVCDQGGECDLQEVTKVFGSDRGRFTYDKRTAHSFYFGPLVHVEMNRCIQCTRCVRFFDELVGQPVLGTMGRGYSNTIATYTDIEMFLVTPTLLGLSSLAFTFNSYILGNVVDVCPVGALTFKPSKNMLRAWEVIVTETIDLLDSLCSNIRIDTCGTTILRVLPRLNVLLNNEWITDKIRFCATGLACSRIFVPSVNFAIYFDHYFGALNYIDYAYMVYRSDIHRSSIQRTQISWEKAHCFIADVLTVYLDLDSNKHSFFAYSGGLLDIQSVYMFKLFCATLGISNVNRHVTLDADLRINYLLSDYISVLFNSCNVFFLLAVDFKQESPMLSLRITNRFVKKQTLLSIGYIGTPLFPKYPVLHLGISSQSFIRFLFGRSSFCTTLYNSFNKSACIIGRSFHTVCSSLRGCYYNFRTYNVLSLLSGDITLNELCARSAFNARTLFSGVSTGAMTNTPLKRYLLKNK